MREPKEIQVPTIIDHRGSLSTFQSDSLGFDLRRVYFIYGATGNSLRGNHAHRKLQQVMIAISGEVSISLDDGLGNIFQFELTDPKVGLYIPEMYWRTFKLTHEAVCLVLASEEYNETDYLRNYREFCESKSTFR